MPFTLSTQVNQRETLSNMTLFSSQLLFNVGLEKCYSEEKASFNGNGLQKTIFFFKLSQYPK